MSQYPGPPVADGERSAGHKVSSKVVIPLVIVALAIWFVAANTHSAKITFWLATVRSPMWIVLLGTFLVGMFAGMMTRRRRRDDKDERGRR
jgi:uncharacterized integral membrane protein